MAKAIVNNYDTTSNPVGGAAKPNVEGRNIGDYRLFRTKRGLAARENFANAKQARNVIFPGEVVLKDSPNRNFTYYWYCPFNSDRASAESELEGLMDEGYEQVKPVEIGGKWVVAERFRRNAEGYPTWAGHVLYALPAEVVEAREAAEKAKANPRGAVAAQLGSFSSESHTLSGGAIEPFISINGKETKL